MKALYIGSTSEYSGKTLICLGLAFRLKADGFKVGYFKPLGKRPVIMEGKVTDESARFFKETFELEEPLETICPVVLTHDLSVQGLKGEKTELKRDIARAYERVKKEKDVVLIGGAGNLYDGAFLEIPGIVLAKAFNWPVIIIDRYFHEICIDCILAASHGLRERLIGTVLNRVIEGSLEHVQGMVAPFLESKNIPVLGVLPQDSTLDSISVQQLLDGLGGNLLYGQEQLEGLVARFAIGAMDAEHALRHFAKIENKAVITGGDRADIQSAALETSTRCLVLTGGFAPNEMVMAKARAAGVPVISVKYDTLTAVERIEGLLGKVSIREERKIARIREMMDAHFDFPRLYRLLNLS